ncbi:cupin domain-containing protein [Actinokineospora pegani]|uniref:cupin domain-containing protein n=1 Tax=Actinokineospora pegani TaxID=2654637 RepID=UPI0012EA2E0F|nr:cupin domain-containing protein [Actinokineospora pegani]
MTVEQIKTALGLTPLPVEGGLWSQSWRDEAFSAIYYLLRAPEFSAWHRLDHPELYAYHAGSPLVLRQIDPDGRLTTTVLGLDFAAGQRPQAVVPAGVWQASETADWSLVGTVVVPPYTDSTVHFPEDLVARFPQHGGVISRLSPGARAGGRRPTTG